MTIAAARPAPSVIIAAEPQLFVRDIDAARAFYTGKLGFRVAFTVGEPPFYAQVVRGGARLNLRHVDGPVFDGRFRAETPDALSATITVDDPEPLVREFESAGARFHQGLRTESWGTRTFIVQDDDGNLVAFAGRADS